MMLRRTMPFPFSGAGKLTFSSLSSPFLLITYPSGRYGGPIRVIVPLDPWITVGWERFDKLEDMIAWALEPGNERIAEVCMSIAEFLSSVIWAVILGVVRGAGWGKMLQENERGEEEVSADVARGATRLR